MKNVVHNRKITLAGVGAVCVDAVLIVLTWRRISGTLVYIWNNTTRDMTCQIRLDVRLRSNLSQIYVDLFGFF